ncbi:Uncharacterised protein [Ectopseudomonas mendocina]|uniref:DUF4262 domain-containing protein n=1 Tax=Ectopseudomonas mendocina TaxID=300 RepID=A0A379PLS0_ECTME|nr:DUF4262 domain-containing protein [Pseudomonas mendocina]SUE95900.1 Uncharacterised protein [Pseudomonas mendocina]
MSSSPYFEAIKANIDRCGIHLFGIFASEDGPGFTYSIGFAAHGLPEVIVFALDMHMVGPYINRYYDEIVNKKTRDAGPAVLMPEDDWFNLPLSVINVESGRAEDFAVQAYAFAEDMGWKKPEFVQWVWSDTAGKMPWQQGYDKERFGKAQPVLARFM